MSLLHRLLSYALVQMIIEVAGFLLLVLLLQSFAPFVPHTLTFNLLFNWLLAILIAGWYMLMSRVLEHRSLADAGLPRQYALRSLLLGFVLGTGMMAVIVGIMGLAGWYRITSIEPAGTIVGPLLVTFLLFCAVAIQEEIVFRGIIFRLLERSLGSWIAIILSALLFGFSHLITPHATLIGALAIAATGGVASAGIYMLTRNLWSVFGLHWAWNFFEGPIFGAVVSGRGTPALLHSITRGPTAWTGGAFGPEAGLITIIIGGCVALVLLVLAMRSRRLLAPPWLRRSQLIPASPLS